VAEDRADLIPQLQDLVVESRCGCQQPDCATIYVAGGTSPLTDDQKNATVGLIGTIPWSSMRIADTLPLTPIATTASQVSKFSTGQTFARGSGPCGGARSFHPGENAVAQLWRNGRRPLRHPSEFLYSIACCRRP
jgi:hypothetical protein